MAAGMPTYVNTFYEDRVERIFDLAGLVERLFASGGLEYRIVGGLAAYLYVEEAAPDAGRLTRDIDIIVRREDLNRIATAAGKFGLEYRHAAGLDMLIRPGETARRAIHLVFAGERIRPDYVEPAPAMGLSRTVRGLRLIPLTGLVRMKLTSFRLKDQTHLKDMEEAGLITPEVLEPLPALLRERFERVRAQE